MNYGVKTKDYPLLNRAEEIQCLTDYHSSDEEVKKAAKDKLILHNMGLIYKECHKYERTKVDPDELVSYGVEGLVNAIDRFDLKCGVKFSTYATSWIKKGIRSGYHNSALVQYPEYIWEGMVRLASLREKFVAEHGREPSYKPCSLDVDFNGDLSDMEEAMKNDSRYSPTAYKLVVQAWEQKTFLSFDQPINNSKDTNEMYLEEIVCDENGYCIEEDRTKAIAIKALYDCIKEIANTPTVTDRFNVARILTLLASGSTVEEMMESTGFSQERVYALMRRGKIFLQRSKILKDLVKCI